MKNISNFIYANALFSSEAAEILQVSRQRLSAIVKEGGLSPIKKDTQGMLFLRSDVENYRINKTNNLSNRIVDSSSNTHQSVRFFEDHISSLSIIQSVFIYFSKVDAAISNFYMPTDFCTNKGLKYVDTPHFVIRDTTGKELWIKNCNCGYGGEGPHGTKDILCKLRDNYNFKLACTDDDLESLIYEKVINIYYNGTDTVDIITRDSIEDLSPGLSVNLFYINNHLILAQDTKRFYSSKNEQCSDILSQYISFISQPTEMVLLPTKELSISLGYVVPSFDFTDEQAYQCIIRDMTGRELWLQLQIKDNMPLYEQKDVVACLEFLGVEPERPSSRLKEVFKRMISSQVAPIVINLRD